MTLFLSICSQSIFRTTCLVVVGLIGREITVPGAFTNGNMAFNKIGKYNFAFLILDPDETEVFLENWIFNWSMIPHNGSLNL